MEAVALRSMAAAALLLLAPAGAACAEAASATAPLPSPPGYEAAVAALPARHWALVRSVTLAYRGRVKYSTSSIELPRVPKASTLHHEVGHLVHAAHPAVAEAWQERFWRGDTLLGTPPSRYGRTSWKEDFATTYEEMLEHGSVGDADRAAFMLRHVFLPGEIRGAK
jgi:hypothetical protein